MVFDIFSNQKTKVNHAFVYNKVLTNHKEYSAYYHLSISLFSNLEKLYQSNNYVPTPYYHYTTNKNVFRSILKSF